MSDYVKDQSRVGRFAYWMYYLGIMGLSLALYGWGIYEFLVLHLLPIVSGFVAPLILSIYFRIIAMRRCRDIGWPAFLPWLTIGIMVVCGIIGGVLAGSHPASAPGTVGLSIVMDMLLGTADLIFLIVIGCIGSAGGGSDAFAAGHFDRRDMSRTSRGYAGGLESAASVRPARPLPKAFGEGDQSLGVAGSSDSSRPVTGFGRRGL